VSAGTDALWQQLAVTGQQSHTAMSTRTAALHAVPCASHGSGSVNAEGGEEAFGAASPNRILLAARAASCPQLTEQADGGYLTHLAERDPACAPGGHG